METLAILLKVLNIYAHNAHNLASRLVFISDHEMLLDIYETADTNYDNVVERIIGLNGTQSIDLMQINLKAAQHASSIEIGLDNATKLKNCLELEKSICSKIEELVRGKLVTVGTEQLLGNICDDSEVRQYKLQQRLVK